MIKGESRTPAFLAKNAICITSPRAPATSPRTGSSTRAFYSGCSSRSTATSPTSRARGFGSSFSNRKKRGREELAKRHEGGVAALGVMEQHLNCAPYFVGARCTIADIALYAYTHVAHEGGFSLAEFPAVRGWIERVESEPGYLAMSEGSP